MRPLLIARWLTVALLLTFAGCSKTPAPASSSSSEATPATTSAGSSNPAVTASSSDAQNTPAPAPQPPVVVDPGTVFTVTIDQSVSTKTNTSGDRFEASLAEPVTIDGHEVLPAGTRATGTVTEAKSAGRVKGGALLALTLDSITVHGERYSIETNSFAEDGKGRGKRTAIGAGGGAAFGAIIGALAGGGKGAAIGALAGGGAGTAGTAFTGKRDFTIPAETRLHFRLVKPLTIGRP
ncbi:MAG TPA: hypothetical protein VNE63_09750 [Candidatus Acidoferrales bacterium]|nr:hypothetical protein [Candidatus Acidoferrales bacterium]